MLKSRKTPVMSWLRSVMRVWEGMCVCEWHCVCLLLRFEPHQCVSGYSWDDLAFCLSARTKRLCVSRLDKVVLVSWCVPAIKRPCLVVLLCSVWASSWTTRGWMGCEVLVWAQTTTYSPQRGFLHYVIATDVIVFPLMQNLCHPTAVCNFTPFLGMPWFKQGNRFSWNTHACLL